MEQSLSDAFSDGEIARWTGYSEDANPYDPEIDPCDYRRWNEGWHSADNDLDDADGD
ncbi:hypothetical protein GCM10007874_39800 [Labrys miyagiensis]|uniref:Uncharacterized protein n=1 Tax=Labrys miyagiensis TaxID=346912 RepID=A0ABQ6CMG1_9HYPH|nr:hypothetical protein [Labrys miyagiensis]GLS20963.1 hypothetical protein GCM10007874_39800 [Labrys miyagiensis]